MLRRFLGCFVLAMGLTGAAGAAGILAPTDRTVPPLRVTDHLVDVTIHDQTALTTLTQTFHNDTNRRLEATYVFPLPENADLTDFQMTFNGKMVKGEVLPAAQARQVYESIVRQTRDPGLIEFIGRQLLQMRVFPIEPGSDTSIQVKYQQICRPISGMSGFHYPLRTCKAAGQAYGMVRFNVALQTGGALKNIWSPSHAVQIVRDGEHAAKIGYEASGGSLEDDFLLLYDTADGDLGLSVIAYKPTDREPGHFVLMLTPRQLWADQRREAQDVVFVIDTSGSMAGEKIRQAKLALQYCIQKLDDRDRFSVVRFSTGFDVLFPELVAATKENREQAERAVEGFSDGGGTNIDDTLRQVMTMRPKAAEGEASRPFVVVFLTDGRGNTPPETTLSVLVAAGADARGMRVFPFGVGHDVNTILLDRLANAYTGKPTYVQPGENLELTLTDFFEVVSRPVLTNLTLALPDIGATERFPVTLGDLYHGQQIIVAGRFNKPMTGAVKLSGVREGKAVECSWPGVAFTNTAQATYVPALWAGRKISYLVDEIRVHGESPEMIAEVVALSQKHGIQTPYTSWLVVPERQAQLAGQWRNMPASMPAPPPGIIDRRQEQSDRLRKLNVPIGGGAPAPTFSDRDGGISAEQAARAVTTGSGGDANIVGRKNAALKELRSKDDDRLSDQQLPLRNIGGRWYNQIGSALVDEAVDEKTEIITVKFGSEAYFELCGKRADLRAVLAAGRNVVAMVAPGRAVLVADDEGLENFTPQQWEQIGLAGG